MDQGDHTAEVGSLAIQEKVSQGGNTADLGVLRRSFIKGGVCTHPEKEVGGGDHTSEGGGSERPYSERRWVNKRPNSRGRLVGWGGNTVERGKVVGQEQSNRSGRPHS